MSYKKLVKWVNFAVLLLVLALSIYLTVRYFFLKEELTSNALQMGYIGILIFTFILEISIQFVGPDILLISGILAGFNFYYVLMFILLGSVLAGLFAYYLGFIYGRKVLGFLFKEEEFERACRFFEKYGKIAMSIAALTPLPYFPVIAGIFKMKFRDFMLYAVAMRVLRFVVLGYFLNLVVGL